MPWIPGRIMGQMSKNAGTDVNYLQKPAMLQIKPRKGSFCTSWTATPGEQRRGRIFHLRTDTSGRDSGGGRGRGREKR